MRKALIGAILGLVVGAGFGTMLALLIHWNQPEVPIVYIDSRQNVDNLWTSSTVVVSEVAIWTPSRVASPPKEDSLSHSLFLGILLGGGFGAVVGTVAGGTAAITRALREARLPAVPGVPLGEHLP